MRKAIYLLIIAAIGTFASLTVSAQSPVVLINQWGTFGDKPGQFEFPTMIAADKNGNVYVVDEHNHRIQKFDSTGKFITMWGKKGNGPGEFYYPYGIAIDSKGNVYVSDMDNNRIEKFSADGQYLASVGSYGTGDGQFKYPYGIAIDKNDILYVIDAFNYRIQKFNTDLKFLSAWGSQESIGIKLYMPHEIAVTKDGNILLSDRQSHRIDIFTKNGKLVKRFGKYGEGVNAGGYQFSEPHGLAVSRAGDIYVTDRYNFRVHKFNAADQFQTMWQTAGVRDNSRHYPLGIVIGKDNCIYVVDHYAQCVQRYKFLKGQLKFENPLK